MKHIGNIQVSGSLQQSGSGDNIFLGNVTISGSTIYKGGSTKFGDDSLDQHQFTGSLSISNAIKIANDNNEINTNAYADTQGYGTWNGVKIDGDESVLIRVANQPAMGYFYDDFYSDVVMEFYATDIVDPGGAFTAEVNSSIRFKENVQDISGSYLDNFDSLRPVSFEWSQNSKLDYGFIAEELTSLYPEWATYRRGELDGYRKNAIITLLVKAVQDLRQRVAQLESGSV